MRGVIVTTATAAILVAVVVCAFAYLDLVRGARMLAEIIAIALEGG